MNTRNDDSKTSSFLSATLLGLMLAVSLATPSHAGVAECGNGVIDTGEDCDDSGICCDDCQYVDAGTLCRSANDECDQDDYCTGDSSDCDDQPKPEGTFCRYAGSDCDVDDYCDGLSIECPDDVADSSVVCRSSAGACDPEESCDGVSDTCPEDAKSGNECRAAAGLCDVAESCDGVSDDCPSDVFVPDGTTCQDTCVAAGACLRGSCVTGELVCTAPPTGMVGWWQGEDNVYDSQGGDDGTLVDDASFADGLVGRAFLLDGDGDKIEVPDAPELSFGATSPLSVDAWVYRTGSESVMHILGKRDGCGAGVTNYQMAFDVNGLGFGTATSGIQPPLNEWTHVAGTFDGSLFRIYVDGVLAGSALGGNGGQTNAPLVIGGSGNCTGVWHGLIDEVEIFNRALSDGEILAIYQARSAGKCATCDVPPGSMVGWWPGDGNAHDIQDGHDGTFENGAAFAAGQVGQAFSFNGVNNRVTTGLDTQPSVMPETTWDAWVLPTRTNFGTRQTIFTNDDAGDDRGVVIESFTSNFAVFTGVGAWQAVPVTLNAWQHIAVVYTPSSIDFYKDGVRYSYGGPPVGQATNNRFTIGANPLGGFREYFQGLIDEVEVFDRALCPAEIEAITSAANFGKCRSCARRPTNLKGWWRAEDDAVNTQDDLNGTLVGNTTFTNGKVGRAFSFHGNGDYVETSYTTGVQNLIGVDAWVRFRSIPADGIQGIVTKDTPDGGGSTREWFFVTETSGGVSSLRFGFSPDGTSFAGNDLSRPFPFAPHVWYHVAASFDSENIHLYVDGTEIGSLAASAGGVYSGSNPVRIGIHGTIPERSFPGDIDEVEVIDGFVDLPTFRAIADAGSTGKCLCGNGHLDPGEQCDDGNHSNTDACPNTCENAYCGDGFTQTGVEACDDGNSNNEDACLDTCVAARCGDGFRQDGVEECDDANAINTDSCLSTCVAARCGDGFVESGVEECDSGTTLIPSTDCCDAACRFEPPTTVCRPANGSCDTAESCTGSSPACPADGHRADGESCDDGVVCTVNDACSAGSCQGTSISPDACLPPPSGMVGWWPGDGSALDIQGDNDGAAQGAVGFSAGKNGQAFSFAGTDGTVVIGDPPALRVGSVTIDAWVKPDRAPTDILAGILTKWTQSSTASYGLWLENSGGTTVLFSAINRIGDSGSNIDGGIVPIGSFSHVAMTYDASTGRYVLYINAQEVAAQTLSAVGLKPTNASVSIGHEVNPFWRPFSGLIDEVEVYDRALSQPELAAIVCAAGKCKCGDGRLDPGEACDDGNRDNGDCCSSTCTFEAGSCEDGDACTTNDTCSEGVCVGGTQRSCDDGLACTTDTCVGAGDCAHAIQEGFCVVGGTCYAAGSRNPGQDCLVCDPATSTTAWSPRTGPCNDSNACTTSDACSGGACVGGSAPNCDDANPCTNDTCVSPFAAQGQPPGDPCVHTNNTNACDDGNPCTTNDRCSAGSCAGGAATNCSDNNPCTNDSCGPTGCVHTNNTNACDDGNACTTNDHCSAGSCSGTSVVCTASDQCHTAGTCAPSTGTCSTPNKANGSACNDGNACTSGESCQNGACTGGTGASSSLNARVDGGIDDAEESSSGSMSLGSSDLELVVDGSTTQKVGMLFEGLGIPRAATITAAWIQFRAKETQSETTALTIQAQAIDNAPDFSSGNISSRARTTASVSWSPDPWTVTGETGPKQKTPDLKSVIQEVVNRGGWAAGQNLAIVIRGSGHRTAYAYDGGASSAPLLHVEWGSCGGSTNRAPNGLIDTPTGNVRITAGQSVNFTGSPSDPDGPTSFSFLWDFGGGAPNRTVEDPGNTTFSAPGTFTVTFTVRDGQGLADPTPDTRVITVDPAGGTVTTLERRIAASSDDAEQRGSSVDLGSSDLELVVDGDTNQTVGLRFTNITIPKGRTIQKAYIQFQADETQSETTNLTLQIQAIDSALTFKDQSNNLSSRSRTGSVAWGPVPSWGTVGQAGVNQRTPDIKSLIQAVVSRSGWASGNALAIIITGTGHRTAESFDGDSAPLLHIEY